MFISFFVVYLARPPGRQRTLFPVRNKPRARRRRGVQHRADATANPALTPFSRVARQAWVPRPARDRCAAPAPVVAFADRLPAAVEYRVRACCARAQAGTVFAWWPPLSPTLADGGKSWRPPVAPHFQAAGTKRYQAGLPVSSIESSRLSQIQQIEQKIQPKRQNARKGSHSRPWRAPAYFLWPRP